jgi:hypothetical protein
LAPVREESIVGSRSISGREAKLGAEEVRRGFRARQLQKDGSAIGMDIELESWEEAHEGPHLFGIMDEKVNVSGHPVPEVRSRKSRAATKMTGDADLTGTDKVENKIRDNTSVEGLTHGLPESH